MKRFILYLTVMFMTASLCKAQNCNNWLSTPTLGSFAEVGQINITGDKITLEATINRTTPYVGGTLYAGDVISKHNTPLDVNYLLRPNEAEITTSKGYFRTPDICEIELNKTYHIAMVYDGTTLKFYRNGFLMSQIAASGNLVQNNWKTQIGFYEPQGFNSNFIGYINEVRIWNVAKTQAQLRAYMNSSLPDPTTQPGLLAYYTFNNLRNKQGNAAYNARLVGSASINGTNPNCAFVADSCSVITNSASIGGIINDYTPVISLDPCLNKVLVADANKYAVGDTVLIIQMKGALIDSTNTAAFGTVRDYKNAGNYEFNYVKSKTGNVIELKNALTRLYNVADGKVQLVRVPYYNDISITSTLSCPPWDGSKGGILVLNVKGNITMNADIDISGKGFMGGQPLFSKFVDCNKTAYFYPAANNEGGQKGEGISSISDLKMYGRGALANGGGGGNAHNAGGAGGGNAGKGGTGGNQYPLALCPNIVPVVGGISGNKLVYSSSANKVFMGGGGGSGHANDLTDKPGGTGGGIAIIMANTITGNSKFIRANGEDVIECTGQTKDCANDGHSGGGAGGSILLTVNQFTNSTNISAKGGKGADAWIMPGSLPTTGPGGGGGGGIIWFSQTGTPGYTTNLITGGTNGVARQFSNDPWGSTPGENGSILFDLKVPVDGEPFSSNIDSVKITDSASSCNQFKFKGIAYTSTSPVTQWQWDFGDNSTANVQTTTHEYAVAGNYLVKLVATDINGCKDSISKTVVSDDGINIDFSYKQDICNPLSVQFFAAGTATANSYWAFGEGHFATNTTTPTNVYTAPGNYIVKYAVQNGSCTDTVTKTISLNIIASDLILTRDTTICLKSSKQLLTVPALSFCWSPTTYLNDPTSPNPITSSPETITYFFTAEMPGNNLITNGSFDKGNTGFTSQYNFAGTNTTEGEYSVGPNPQAWNGNFSTCKDHTGVGGNMMLVNGAPVADVPVWTQTVPVTPNTNYAFSTWIQALYPPNPAQLSFSINGGSLGNLITASVPTCNWDQFYTTWNSGSSTTAVISIVNKNTLVMGNDFALDDISFSPVLIKRDSVTINIDSPSVSAGTDTSTCEGQPVQLSAAGAASYNWLPSVGLNNAGIANPTARPNVTTQYIVTGTSSRGCTASDTVNVRIKSLPLITKSADSAVCGNLPVQLFAAGGVSYSWSPAATLNSSTIPNPIAAPAVNTTYRVTVTGTNTCSKTDSVKISIAPPPVFSISPDKSTCLKSNVLSASGGNSYLWSPAALVSDPNSSNPVATTNVTTTFTVKIKDNVCNDSATLMTTVNVLPSLSVSAFKSNDIDCVSSRAQLTATGGNQYVWSPAAGLNNSNIANPTASVTTQQQYVVTAIDTVTKCSGMATVTLFVKGTVEPMVYIPTAFSPNGDGHNDCFKVNHFGTVKSVDMSIYNRWGTLVYHSLNVTDCWNGTFKGSPVDAGNYVYYIKTANDCGTKTSKGNLMLIR